jgi:hypothetical protein
LITRLGEINDTVFGISILSMMILCFFKVFIDKQFQSKLRVPFPIELLVVVIFLFILVEKCYLLISFNFSKVIFGTIISKYVNLSENFDVSIVGPIPGIKFIR